MTIPLLSLLCVFAPLLGAFIAGIFGKRIGKAGAHTATIALVSVSFLAAVMTGFRVVWGGESFYGTLYHWGSIGQIQFDVGFQIDSLSALMMMIVTFVSLVVHVYSMGYMADDPGYQRFFSYVSAFTFAMLMLVTANNFFQLFFGWEGVGLVSYLLIGFWFTKESAAQGSLKAFLVNRAGDFGFIIGIAAIMAYVGSVDYQTVFAQGSHLADLSLTVWPGTSWSVISMICILLFIGAMGKSAQMPLHVWLPESMEGPTPISALIHAATMVTAGIFMVARLSPLFEYSAVALSVVLIIGATGALFTGLLAFVENDIKRVIAFSTMSQLGYMMAADGVSAFSAGIFHLMTHACFKALLFLAAGSVIIAMHHEQDLRKMGNLKKYLPMTTICFLIGALSLSAIPPFSGFYSKDAIIEAVLNSNIPGSTYAYGCLLAGAFVTGYYIFRAYFMAFHTEERMDMEVRRHLKETPWSMRSVLLVLAVPSTVLGAFLVGPMLYNAPTLLGNSVLVLPNNNVLTVIGAEFHGAWSLFWHAPFSLTFWVAAAGIFMAWWTVIAAPYVRETLKNRLPRLYTVLIKQYGFDAFNQRFFVLGSQKMSNFFYQYADLLLIDHYMVNGSGRAISRLSQLLRKLQSGYLYHYVLAMMVGIVVFLVWFILG